MKAGIRNIQSKLKRLKIFPLKKDGVILIHVNDKKISSIDKIEGIPMGEQRVKPEVFVKSLTFDWVDTREESFLYSKHNVAEILLRKDGREFEIKYRTNKIAVADIKEEATEIFK